MTYLVEDGGEAVDVGKVGRADGLELARQAALVALLLDDEMYLGARLDRVVFNVARVCADNIRFVRDLRANAKLRCRRCLT